MYKNLNSSLYTLTYPIYEYIIKFSHPTISRAEREYISKCIGAGQSQDVPPVPWRHVFTSGPVWALILTHIAQVYVL